MAVTVSNIQSELEVHDESITWFIDRIGDPLIINDLHYSSNNSFSSLSMYPISNIIQNNYIINYRADDIIYNPEISYNYIISPKSIPSEIILEESIEFTEEQCDCCICMDQKDAENICQFNCGHVFCVTCVNLSIQTFRSRLQDVTCSLCRASVEKITVKTKENKDTIQLSLL